MAVRQRKDPALGGGGGGAKRNLYWRLNTAPIRGEGGEGGFSSVYWVTGRGQCRQPWLQSEVTRICIAVTSKCFFDVESSHSVRKICPGSNPDLLHLREPCVTIQENANSLTNHVKCSKTLTYRGFGYCQLSLIMTRQLGIMRDCWVITDIFWPCVSKFSITWKISNLFCHSAVKFI